VLRAQPALVLLDGDPNRAAAMDEPEQVLQPVRRHDRHRVVRLQANRDAGGGLGPGGHGVRG